MDYSKYPPNWREISLQVRGRAKWKCQECHKECRRPKESLQDFHNRLVPAYLAENGDISEDIRKHPQRYTLTVAHLDHDTTNNAPENLKALCSVCHLRYDIGLHVRNRSGNKYRKSEQNGQLSLW